MDNLQEFRDPVNYDLEELPGSPDRIAFMCKLALRSAGPVLDLACGTGIVSLPLALLGLTVTGVDLSEPMIAHARRKARTLGTIADFLVDDMRTFAAPTSFAFVALSGNAFQALLTKQDQSKLLRVVADHLEERGRFVFETRNPKATDLRDSRTEEPWFTYVNATGEEVKVSGIQSYDESLQVLTWTSYRRWANGDGQHIRRSEIACRFTDVDDLDALLATAGLRVTQRYGSWDYRPFTSRSSEIISVCERT